MVPNAGATIAPSAQKRKAKAFTLALRERFRSICPFLGTAPGLRITVVTALISKFFQALVECPLITYICDTENQRDRILSLLWV